MIISNCSVATSSCWKHLMLEGFGTLPLVVWSWIFLSVKHFWDGLSLISDGLCFSHSCFPFCLTASVWGKGDGKRYLPWEGKAPCFSETLFSCPGKGVREELSSKSRRESIWRINGWGTGEFPTPLVMWNSPESPQDYQCPLTIASELATVGIWAPPPLQPPATHHLL